jgi:hypothetical protein
MTIKSNEPKRRNRTLSVGDALGGAIDPALRKRGFASRDLIAHWGAMVPEPYDRVTAPDRLSWPRGTEAANGATLYVRCADGHAHEVAHEGPRLTASINRYFGYVLVGAVRISAEPMLPVAKTTDFVPEPLDAEAEARLKARISGVADKGLREALWTLGAGLQRRGRK